MTVTGILGTGSYTPDREVTNEELAARFGVTPDWITGKTGIGARRYAAPDEAASDLAVRAAERALTDAGTAVDDIDHIVVSTSTGDHAVPPTATLVQAALGAARANCMDINVACSGFVHALVTARGLLALEPGRRALVVATDVWSRFIDPADRSTAVLLGDGAGAAVLGPVPAPGAGGFLGHLLRGHGDAHRMLVVPAGGSRQPASARTVEETGHVLRMKGREVTEFVHAVVPGEIRELLAAEGLAPADIDHFVPHQANGVLLEKVVATLGLRPGVARLTLDRYGNTGSASVAITLDEARRSGAVADGDLLLLSGFGGGMTHGSVLVRWHGDGAR
ncbi:3-oxoacyl-ACP synthase III family protein [Streptomyces sp. NPDC003691]